MRNNIIPESRLFLLKDVPLTPDYEYTLDFNNEADQTTYMGAKIDTRLEEQQYSYIREDDTIKIALPIEETDGINYMSFYNNGKVYYAFIERKEYVNPECTKLYFKIDVFQTFMFDYVLQESFVDREHQDRLEYVGFSANRYKYLRKYNRIAENLELGRDYQAKGRVIIPSFSEETETSGKGFYIVKSSKPLGEHMGDKYPDPTRQGGISTGVFVYIVPSISTFLKVYNSALSSYTHEFKTGDNELIDQILENSSVLSATFTKYTELPITIERDVPDDLDNPLSPTSDWLVFNSSGSSNARATLAIIKYNKLDTIDTTAPIFALRSVSDNFVIDIDNEQFLNQIEEININSTKREIFETKLFTYPYRYMRFNINGKTFNINREDCGNPSGVVIARSYNPQGTMSAIPFNYNGANYDYNNQFDIENVGDVTLSTNKWQEYLLNNKASVNGGLITSGVQTLATIGLGVATGGVGLAFAGGQAISFAGQVANELMKREDIKNQPNDVKASKFDIMINQSLNMSLWFYENMEIKDEFRQNIFEYFYHFGYKCNTFKKPDTRSRYYFNYIKTIGVKIKSGIDRRWEDELKSIYNNGVTIWHWRNENTFKGVNNYDYENVEMALIGGSNGN